MGSMKINSAPSTPFDHLLVRLRTPGADPVLDSALQRALDRKIRERERRERSGQLDEIRARCATLPGFITEAWKVLEPAVHLETGWAQDAIADHLMGVSHGHIARLLMNVPPGMMKSLMSNVFWPAFEWGPWAAPHLRYLNGSYQKGHAERDTKKMYQLVTSDWYQDLWPHVHVTSNSAAIFHNDATGWRKGVPVASFTGDRGDRVTWDDPHSVMGGESVTVRNKTLLTMREVVPTRLNDPKKSAIIVIMQRIHANDVSGMIIREKLGYTHLMLPMRFEEARRCTTMIGGRRFTDPRAYEGELLFPERFDAESVDRTEHEMTAYAIAGQMQQRPTPREGGLFKMGWFEIVDALPTGWGRSVRAWDLAATVPKPGSMPDWTVGIRVLLVDGVFYVTHMTRFQGDPGDVTNAVITTAQADTTQTIIRLPQDPGQAGKAQAHSFVGHKKLQGFGVVAKPVTGDKATRASPAASQAKVGNVKLLAANWNQTFLDELTTFPAGVHDDIVDAFADAIDELTQGFGYNLDNV